jgi:hypothetical protein
MRSQAKTESDLAERLLLWDPAGQDTTLFENRTGKTK